MTNRTPSDPGARPVAFDVDRGRLHPSLTDPAPETNIPAEYSGGISTTGSPHRFEMSLAVETVTTAVTRWAVVSLDGGAGRTTLALALAGTLAAGNDGGGRVLLVDGNPSPWPVPAALLKVDPCPANRALYDPQPWPTWIPTSTSRIALLTGAAPGHPAITTWDLQRVANLLGAIEYRHIITDWPAGNLPAVTLGHTLLITRADTNALERVVQLLNSTTLDPARTTLILNQTTTTSRVDRRAKALATTLHSRVHQLVHLRHDPALATTPDQPTKLTAATTAALTRIITKGTPR